MVKNGTVDNRESPSSACTFKQLGLLDWVEKVLPKAKSRSPSKRFTCRLPNLVELATSQQVWQAPEGRDPSTIIVKLSKVKHRKEIMARVDFCCPVLSILLIHFL
jgi:hypothetical protein